MKHLSTFEQTALKSDSSTAPFRINEGTNAWMVSDDGPWVKNESYTCFLAEDGNPASHLEAISATNIQCI